MFVASSPTWEAKALRLVALRISDFPMPLARRRVVPTGPDRFPDLRAAVVVVVDDSDATAHQFDLVKLTGFAVLEHKEEAGLGGDLLKFD